PGQYQGFFCHTKSTIRNTFAYPALDNFLVMTKFLEGVSTPELTQLKSKVFLPDYKLPLGDPTVRTELCSQIYLTALR
ncbi:hypothetical protein ACIKSB_19090, partial [Acinetobacter baumannii]